MLTISQPLSSGQAHAYHAEEFTSRSQAYYSEEDNVYGEWQGWQLLPRHTRYWANFLAFLTADDLERLASQL